MTPDVAMTRCHATGGLVCEIKLTAIETRYEKHTKPQRQTALAFSNPTRLTRNAEEFSNLSWLCNEFDLRVGCNVRIVTNHT